ncbi:MAG: biotin--[acetyl-CoA-carboxylase] ligase, partial [Sandaracinobacteroides sp.]
ELGERLAAAFAARRARWAGQGFPEVRADWLARAHPLGALLWVSTGEGRLEGRFAGLSDTGSLLLDGADGKVHVIHAGDVWSAWPAGQGEG